MGLNTSGWTPAASIRRMRLSLGRRSIPCFGGIRTLCAATSTFQMSQNPTLERMTRGHGKRTSGRVDGSLEAGRCKSLSRQGWLTFLARRVSRLGSKLSLESIIHEITGHRE